MNDLLSVTVTYRDGGTDKFNEPVAHVYDNDGLWVQLQGGLQVRVPLDVIQKVVSVPKIDGDS